MYMYVSARLLPRKLGYFSFPSWEAILSRFFRVDYSWRHWPPVATLLSFTAHQIVPVGLGFLPPGITWLEILVAMLLKSNHQLLKNIPRSHCPL